MKRAKASGVTLCAVTSVAHEATIAAMHHSLEQLGFERALFLSDSCPTLGSDAGIEWRCIAPLTSRNDYSRFVLHELADHIESDHVLIVQWDGFVRDGQRWQDAFLDYDYIGAPWPQFCDDNAVGNGGFSLRSRKLLMATKGLAVSHEPEDISICRTYRRELELKYGVKFAGMDMAESFSYERGTSRGVELGFHGVFNMYAELGVDHTGRLLKSLEPGLIAQRESVELLVQSIRKRDFSVMRLALIHYGTNSRRFKWLLRGFVWLLSRRLVGS
jgi:hypothetical protein